MAKVPDPSLAKASADLRTLSVDLAQIVLDIAGLADPTPICDGANTVISLVRGDWWGAGMNALSMIPYVGDLAKAGKFPKYLKTVERAIVAAQESEAAARLLAPIMARIQQALDLLPQNAGPQVAQLRTLVADFFAKTRLPSAARRLLPDISSQFRFRRYSSGGYDYHEAAGRLGVPGTVMTHRSPAAQSSLSSGLGEDAGHLIGNRFGAPGGSENLGLQNWRANRYGTFKQLENHWAHQLQNGTGVEVLVRDIYKSGDPRPFARKVRWSETHPNGSVTHHELDYMNAHTERSRNMQNVPATVLEPQTNNVIEVDFQNRRRR